MSAHDMFTVMPHQLAVVVSASKYMIVDRSNPNRFNACLCKPKVGGDDHLQQLRNFAVVAGSTGSEEPVSQQFDTSLPSDFQKKGSPTYSRELQRVKSCKDDDDGLRNRRAEHDDSEVPAILGKKSAPPHWGQHECEDKTEKYDPHYSSPPTEFGKRNKSSHSRGPKRGGQLGFGNSGYLRGLKKFEPFDICKSDVTNPVNLNSPLHVSNRNTLDEIKHSMEGNTHKVLRRGMVLLKDYLTHTEQVLPKPLLGYK